MLKKILLVLSFIGIFATTPLRAAPEMKEAVFAMGCFWCGEAEFHHVPGVISIKVGYAGGVKPRPTYPNHEGYKEAVKVTYDPAVISYEKLLNIFWVNIDPTDSQGQFCDRGPSYTSAIYYKDDAQKNAAEESKGNYQRAVMKDFYTEILPFTTFVNAEGYHQNYKENSPVRYKYYRWKCGRDQRLEALWGNLKRSAQ